jgi:ABC-type glycerol-3-phosphate transport system substrate-binding protein
VDQSVREVFDKQNAGMVFEGDFLVSLVEPYVDSAGLGTTANFFDFPSFFAGRPPSVMAGGDIAVMTRNTGNAAKLIQYLASPDSARIWAAKGGLVSPNIHVPLQTYPDPVSRQSATELINAKVVRFDLSDLLPPSFGSTPNAGLWAGLYDLLTLPPEQRTSEESIKQTLSTLEARAKSAYTRPPSCPGS